MKHWVSAVYNMHSLGRVSALSSEVLPHLPQCNNTPILQLSLLHRFPVSKKFNGLKVHSNAAPFPAPHSSSTTKIAPIALPFQSLLVSQTLPLLQFRGSFTQSGTITVSCSDRKFFLLPPFYKTSNK